MFTGQVAADKVGGRHAEVDDTEAGASVKLGELLLGSGETDAQSLDFAEPALAFGFGDAGGEVVADVDQPCSLSRIRSEERASDTSVLMNARCSEGACAGTDGNLPFLEVGEESVPFFVGGGSVLFAGTGCPAAGDERPVGFDRLGCTPAGPGS